MTKNLIAHLDFLPFKKSHQLQSHPEPPSPISPLALQSSLNKFNILFRLKFLSLPFQPAWCSLRVKTLRKLAILARQPGRLIKFRCRHEGGPHSATAFLSNILTHRFQLPPPLFPCTFLHPFPRSPLETAFSL